MKTYIITHWNGEERSSNAGFSIMLKTDEHTIAGMLALLMSEVGEDWSDLIDIKRRRRNGSLSRVKPDRYPLRLVGEYDSNGLTGEELASIDENYLVLLNPGDGCYGYATDNINFIRGADMACGFLGYNKSKVIVKLYHNKNDITANISHN